MAFWDAKIACEQCNKKTKEKTALYRRGSKFCSNECIAANEVANPPPVATGDHGKLREELIMLLDQAFVEANRRFGSAVRVPEGITLTVSFGIGLGLGDIDEAHRIEAMNAAYALFQTHTLRCAPILRALGFPQVATAIDSTDFLAHDTMPLINQLFGVRKQL
jgi:hypothetical protein